MIKMKLKKILFETLALKGKNIAKRIYDYVFKHGKEKCLNIGYGHFDCHPSVEFVKTDKELKSFWWHKYIKYHEWDEYKWKKVSLKLKKDNKKFSDKNINNLIEDIIGGTVNGHSFLSFEGYFIDPYLKSLKVKENEIQKFDKYFLGVM